MEEIIDSYLLSMAVARMAHYDPATVLSSEEMDRILGITEEDIIGFNEVEFED